MIDAQNSDDVPTASVDTIRSLYRRLYRPDNMMIVIVGNVNADEVRSLIERRFGDWKPSKPAPARISAPDVPTRSHPSDQLLRTPASAPDGANNDRPPDPRPTFITRAPSPGRDHGPARHARDQRSARLASLQPASPRGKVGMFIENGDQGHWQIMLWDNYAGDSGRWQLGV